MKTRFFTSLLAAIMVVSLLSGCSKQGPQGPEGPAGQDAKVYYSEWFSPTAWSGNSGDWYFVATAPDLTEDIVERGIVLAYAWLDGDLYNSTTVRPLPANAVGANWSFLVHEYGSIEFTSNMFSRPVTSGNKFRFVAIPGNIPALKSAIPGQLSEQELKSLSYREICKMFNIPE